MKLLVEALTLRHCERGSSRNWMGRVKGPYDCAECNTLGCCLNIAHVFRDFDDDIALGMDDIRE